MNSPCTSSITAPAATSTTYQYTLAGASTSGTYQPSGSWDSYFSNTDTANCPITSCNLYTYDAAGSTCEANVLSDPRISISGTSPWVISVSKAYSNGYTIRFCLQCTNRAQTKTITGETIILNNLCPASTLTTQAAQSKSIAFVHGGSTTTVSPTNAAFNSWDIFFSNTDTI